MSKVNASEDDVEDILTPITKEEIHECMTNFHNYIDAKSLIYGCAACALLKLVLYHRSTIMKFDYLSI